MLTMVILMAIVAYVHGTPSGDPLSPFHPGANYVWHRTWTEEDTGSERAVYL